MFFLDLATTILGYILLTCVYIGFGWLIARLLGIDLSISQEAFTLIWLGWAITLFVLQTLNLFLPISGYLSLFLLIIGLVSFIDWMKRYRSNHKPFRLPHLYVILMITATIWIAILSMVSPRLHDSGAYHFSSIRWLNEFPIVLGLGNLMSRLAFNQSFFTYVASLNVYPFFNHGYNLANSYLTLILLGEFLLPLSKYCFNRSRATGVSIFSLTGIFLIPAIIYIALTSILSTPSPDIASSILQILLFVHFVREIDEFQNAHGNDERLIFILILSATAITLKLSNLFYVLSIDLILLFIRLKAWRTNPRPDIWLVLRSIGLPILIVFVWIFRGILLSGCPLYPSTLGCIHTRWSVSIQTVKSEADWIYSWARMPNEPLNKVLGSWEWLRPWFYRVLWGNIVTVVYPSILFILGAILSLFIFIFNPLTGRINKDYLIIPVPMLIGLLFWFYMAPDIRFANSLFWILPVGVLVIIIKILELSLKVRKRIFIAMFFILNAGIFWFFGQNAWIFTKLQTRGY